MTKIETGRGVASFEPLAVTVNNSTSEVTLFSTTIQASKMGQTKRVSFFVDCTLSTALSLVPTLTMNLKFGSATLAVMSSGVLGVGVSNRPLHVEGYIANLDSAVAQFAWAQIQQNGQNPVMAVTSMGQDTTADKVLSITAQFGGLSLGTSLAAKYGNIELS